MVELNKEKVMIELKNLSKQFETTDGSVDALRHINLSIRAGDVYGIIGMSGAGKLTAQKMLEDLGWEYISCSDDGNETVYLRDGELPTEGAIICRIDRHAVAIVDGVIHDTFNSAGDGSKKVYGYWKKRCEEEDRMIESR